MRAMGASGCRSSSPSTRSASRPRARRSATTPPPAHPPSAWNDFRRAERTCRARSSIPGADPAPPICAEAATRVGQLAGVMTAANLSAGQPITPGLVTKPGEDLAQSDIPYLPLPGGYVATTVPTSEQQGVAGYIRAGDSISVVAVVPTTPG